MNRVLVTGLGLYYEVDACQACNFDLDWLVRYPSVLLWADRVLVTGGFWETMRSGQAAYPELGRAVRLVFEMADAEGMVEVVDPAEAITPDLRDALFEQVQEDRASLARVFPNHIRLGDDSEVPGQIFVDGCEYCAPYLWSIHAGLVLARKFDAHCLFSQPVFDYCRYKFGLSGFPNEAKPGWNEAFHSVFEAYLPNSPLLPEYVVVDKTLCASCLHEEACRDNYLAELEKNVRGLLAWRDYDEVQQFKAVVRSVVEKRNKAGSLVDPEDVMSDLRAEQDRLRRRVRLVFPKVKRWANVSTMLSLPVAVAGVASEVPLLTVSGAALAGASKLAKELVELLSSRYSWIGFVSKEIELHRQR